MGVTDWGRGFDITLAVTYLAMAIAVVGFSWSPPDGLVAMSAFLGTSMVFAHRAGFDD